MKRALSVVLALAIVLAYQPLPLAAGQNTGEISGTAMSAGKPLAKACVRLRNVDTGQLVGTQTTNERGEYRFTGVPPGNYVVELVDCGRGALLGTSSRISLTSAAMVSKGVTVTASAAATATGATAGAGGFFGSTAGIVTIAAIAAGITIAAIAAQGEGSPSR